MGNHHNFCIVCGEDQAGAFPGCRGIERHTVAEIVAARDAATHEVRRRQLNELLLEPQSKRTVRTFPCRWTGCLATFTYAEAREPHEKTPHTGIWTGEPAPVITVDALSIKLPENVNVTLNSLGGDETRHVLHLDTLDYQAHDGCMVTIVLNSRANVQRLRDALDDYLNHGGDGGGPIS